MSDKQTTHTGCSIKKISHDYLRIVEKAEAKKEELLAEWVEVYRPGYLTDDEWETLKGLVESSDHEHALMQVEITAYRKAATELGRADEFDDDWPAKKQSMDVGVDRDE